MSVAEFNHRRRLLCFVESQVIYIYTYMREPQGFGGSGWPRCLPLSRVSPGHDHDLRELDWSSSSSGDVEVGEEGHLQVMPHRLDIYDDELDELPNLRR